MTFKVQDPGSGRGEGLSDSLRVLVATLLAIFYTRVELLSTEFEEQWVWLSSILGCRPFSTRDWEAQLPRIAATGFNLAGRGPHKLCRPRVIVGLLRPSAFGCCIDSPHRVPGIAYCILGCPSWYESCKARASP